VAVPGEKPESHQESNEAAENEAATESYSFLKRVWWLHGAFCRLTEKLRGRPEAPDQAPRAHNLFRARGATTQTVHGPLQRLLDARGYVTECRLAERLRPSRHRPELVLREAGHSG
jgi:hypothetical protein